ncbi:hypothetical protein Lfu02_01820 [Longispora fulva]|uniref:WXG100 family type VII secretion target n=1 Tax=Longispora fulva TaxID=619741 RepID=A0A8J7GS15_9ACTN|nr:hypothetical protein [Longispora fulva]MBG6135946.1 hypothetical protein [Longispora fulva]GIG55810.1 hypothetical protein Lfu02_01820 [Longispora fulva]
MTAYGLVGMDPDSARTLAAAMRRAAERMEDQSRDMTVAITGVHWAGTDSRAFRAAWQATMLPAILKVTGELRRHSAELTLQAAEQIQASAAGGAVSGPSSTGPVGAEHSFGPVHYSGSSRASGPDVGFSTRRSSADGVAGFDGHAMVGKADADGVAGLGPVLLTGHAEVSVGAQVSGVVKLDKHGLVERLSASEGVQASAERRADIGPASHTIGVSGLAGAEAEAHLVAGTEGIGVGADAFAGVKGEVEQKVDVGGVGYAGTGEAYLGIGAHAEGTIGMKNDGTFGLRLDAGAALGPGAGFSINLTVDPGKVADTAKDVKNRAGDVLDDVADTGGHVIKKLRSLW